MESGGSSGGGGGGGGDGSSQCFSTSGGKEPEIARLQRELEQKLAKINEMKRERDELKSRLEKQQLPLQEEAAFKRLVEDFNALSNKYNSMLHESSLGKGT